MEGIDAIDAIEDRGLRIDIIDGMGWIGGFGGLLVGVETLAQKNLASDYVN